MHKLDRQLGALVVLAALAASAWSQTARYTVPGASVTDAFSSYHAALANAADVTLANVVREAEIVPQTATTPENTSHPDGRLLHQFAEQYWNGNDEAVHRAIARVMQLRPVLTPILRREGLPDDIAALVLVESAGQPAARSPKGARGIWQFMPDTARRYGLTVNSETDDRLDVQKSTRAAARYLRHLHMQFRSWPLALAAYNTGEKLVQNAVMRAGTEDFALLAGKRLLPAETMAYVPAVLAAATLLSGDRRFETSQSQSAGSPSVLYASSAGGGGR